MTIHNGDAIEALEHLSKYRRIRLISYDRQEVLYFKNRIISSNKNKSELRSRIYTYHISNYLLVPGCYWLISGLAKASTSLVLRLRAITLTSLRLPGFKVKTSSPLY